MRYLTLLEKLKILIDVLMTFKFVLVLIAIMLILTILFIFKKLSNKKYTILDIRIHLLYNNIRINYILEAF